MAKVKTQFVCQACGAEASKWSGQCADCEAWNTLQESVSIAKTSARRAGYAGQRQSEVTALDAVPLASVARVSSGLNEFDRVLGGGIVPGSVVLIGGDPGIGKSTILLQVVTTIAASESALYVTGEESLQQVAFRAQRLNLPDCKMGLLTETHCERIIDAIRTSAASVVVIDSIQTIYTDTLQSTPGSVSQIREATALLVQLAKTTGVTLFIVGHVTKEGALAGPRVLEHMVDTVLYFEGQTENRFRIIRAVKNRFGAVNEIGIFAMTETGIKEVSNPSAIFLSQQHVDVAGSCVTVIWEGSRPMLLEVQALVDESHLGNPRRITVGIDNNRLSLCLAVMHRHGGIATFNQDIFLNVVGGVRINETSADLACLLAVLSSFKDVPIPNGVVVFGELGLAGELRPVQAGQQRLKEAAKHGFTTAIVPKGNTTKQGIAGLKIYAVATIQEVLDVFEAVT